MNSEFVGIIIIVITSLLGLIAMVVKPFNELTQAIHSLRILVERLISNHENMQEFLIVLDRRLTDLEKRTQGVELNCARNNQHNK